MADISQDRLTIKGGIQLNGEVDISGAKNSILKQMAAAILLPGKSIIHNAPELTDIDNMIEIIKFLGGEVKRDGGTIEIDCTELSSNFVPFELAGKLRASFIILGALFARFKEAKVSLPGGCLIGARKLDLHFKGLKALGAKITEDQGYVIAKAEKNVGAKIHLDVPSNGATENIMLAAALAEGETVLENAASDPEIVDLANFLNEMGCDIQGAGTSTIHIHGKKAKDLNSLEYSTMPDRVEAATYLVGGLITGGKVKVKSVIEEDLHSLLSKLKEVGAEVKIRKSRRDHKYYQFHDITVDAAGNKLKGTDITTMWYPGFPTDMQPQISALLATCKGTSTVVENIYESRFQHMEELKRMGADISVNGKVAVIKGVKQLNATKLQGTDLRNTASLVIAALAAKGTSQVAGLEFLDRGYEKFEEKFSKLGADIKRTNVKDHFNSEEGEEAQTESSEKELNHKS